MRKKMKPPSAEQMVRPPQQSWDSQVRQRAGLMETSDKRGQEVGRRGWRKETRP